MMVALFVFGYFVVNLFSRFMDRNFGRYHEPDVPDVKFVHSEDEKGKKGRFKKNKA